MPYASRATQVAPAPRRTRSPRRRRTIIGLLASAALVFGLTVPGAVVPAQAAGNARAIDASFNQQVLHYTNVERQKRGLRPLSMRACPGRFATRHVKRLAARDAFRHQRLRPVLRQCKARTVGENLAWRRPTLTPQQVVAQWMGSAPHRANILAPRFSYLGVDAFRSQRSGRIYVGQVFAG